MYKEKEPTTITSFLRKCRETFNQSIEWRKVRAESLQVHRGIREFLEYLEEYEALEQGGEIERILEGSPWHWVLPKHRMYCVWPDKKREFGLLDRSVSKVFGLGVWSRTVDDTDAVIEGKFYGISSDSRKIYKYRKGGETGWITDEAQDPSTVREWLSEIEGIFGEVKKFARSHHICDLYFLHERPE